MIGNVASSARKCCGKSYYYFRLKPLLVGKFGSKISKFPLFYSKNDPHMTPTSKVGILHVWALFFSSVLSFFPVIPLLALCFSHLETSNSPPNEVIGLFYLGGFFRWTFLLISL